MNQIYKNNVKLVSESRDDFFLCFLHFFVKKRYESLWRFFRIEHVLQVRSLCPPTPNITNPGHATAEWRTVKSKSLVNLRSLRVQCWWTWAANLRKSPFAQSAGMPLKVRWRQNSRVASMEFEREFQTTVLLLI